MSQTNSPAPAPSETGATIQLPAGVEPNLNELFDRNPLEWSDDDLNKVILHMRKAREIFHKEDTTAKAAGRLTNAKKALTTGGASSLTLSDLGL